MIVSFDFSGAGYHHRSQRGIARARGGPGDVPGVTHGIARTAVLEELCQLARGAHAQGSSPLVGLDFAFSFPRAAKPAFPGGALSREEFWSSVAGAIWPQGRAQDFVDAHPADFKWHDQQTITGTSYAHALRLTESAAHAAGVPANTVFKLIGANQVGKGSLCGIAILERLRVYCVSEGLPLAIWPFFFLSSRGIVTPFDEAYDFSIVSEPCLTVVETYPAIQKAQGGHTVNAAANHFGGVAPQAQLDLTGDDVDAMITWYALGGTVDAQGRPLGMARLQAPSAALLAQPHATILLEGWIFGL